jgi:DNA-directed RNA polymerase delta subunit
LELEELKGAHLIHQAKYGKGETEILKDKKWEVKVYINPEIDEKSPAAIMKKAIAEKYQKSREKMMIKMDKIKEVEESQEDTEKEDEHLDRQHHYPSFEDR